MAEGSPFTRRSHCKTILRVSRRSSWLDGLTPCATDGDVYRNRKRFRTYVVWHRRLFVSGKHNTESLPMNFFSFVMSKRKENCTSPVRCIQGTKVWLLRVTAACPVFWYIPDVSGYTHSELSNYVYTIFWKLKNTSLMASKNQKVFESWNQVML